MVRSLNWRMCSTLTADLVPPVTLVGEERLRQNTFFVASPSPITLEVQRGAIESGARRLSDTPAVATIPLDDVTGLMGLESGGVGDGMGVGGDAGEYTGDVADVVAQLSMQVAQERVEAHDRLATVPFVSRAAQAGVVTPRGAAPMTPAAVVPTATTVSMGLSAGYGSTASLPHTKSMPALSGTGVYNAGQSMTLSQGSVDTAGSVSASSSVTDVLAPLANTAVSAGSTPSGTDAAVMRYLATSMTSRLMASSSMVRHSATDAKTLRHTSPRFDSTVRSSTPETLGETLQHTPIKGVGNAHSSTTPEHGTPHFSC